MSDIALINIPMLTGSAMVDALAPIGNGKNMLIIRQDIDVGQRDLVIEAVRSHVRNKDAKGIYAITSRDEAEKEEVTQMF